MARAALSATISKHWDCSETRGFSAGVPFTLAFLDPPYSKGLVEPALAGLVSGKWLAENALAVVETGSDETITPDGWEPVETRDYGAARIWFLKRV